MQAGGLIFFFFNDTATTEIYTLSLHDALPIYWPDSAMPAQKPWPPTAMAYDSWSASRSEEHTSELQSLTNLVCRLLLEKKKAKRPLIRAARHARGGRERSADSLRRRHHSARHT